MNIISEKETTNLKLTFENGEKDGKLQLLSKSYSKVKPNADDANIYNVGKILSDLQSKELFSISKVETSILLEE